MENIRNSIRKVVGVSLIAVTIVSNFYGCTNKETKDTKRIIEAKINSAEEIISADIKENKTLDEELILNDWDNFKSELTNIEFAIYTDEDIAIEFWYYEFDKNRIVGTSKILEPIPIKGIGAYDEYIVNEKFRIVEDTIIEKAKEYNPSYKDAEKVATCWRIYQDMGTDYFINMTEEEIIRDFIKFFMSSYDIDEIEYSKKK